VLRKYKSDPFHAGRKIRWKNSSTDRKGGNIAEMIHNTFKIGGKSFWWKRISETFHKNLQEQKISSWGCLIKVSQK
jgi:hypothetical protein